MTAPTAHLDALLHARHIVFVGGAALAKAISACREIGYVGRISIVSRTRAEIGGIACLPSLAALDSVPDAAFVAVRNTETVEVVRELAALGVKACVCHAGGFADAGEAGLEAALLDAAGPMALLGPNSYGVLNYLDGVALWPDHHGGSPVEHGVALICQGARVCLGQPVLDRALPLAYVVQVGNQIQLDVAQWMDVLLDDPRVSAIGLCFDSLTDVAGFSRAVLKAREKNVPVVVVKASRSDGMGQFGADRIYDALFERYGIVRAASQLELLEILKFLALSGPLTGRRLGVLGCTGADASLAADFAAANRLLLPQPDITCRARLAAYLAPARFANPLDCSQAARAGRQALADCFTQFLTDGLDAGVLLIDYPGERHGARQAWDMAINAWIDAYSRTTLPMAVVSNFPEKIPAAVCHRLASVGITPLRDLESALRVLDAAVRVSEGWVAMPAAPLAYARQHDDGDDGAGNPPAEADVEDRTETVVGHAVVEGEPAESRRVPGLIRVNLRSREEVERAVEMVGQRTRAGRCEALHLLIEPMLEGTAVEVVVGVTRDPVFGPVLTLGAGGALVDLIEDSQVLLLPASAEEIEDALRSLRCFVLLEGQRGNPPVDLPTLVATIAQIARLVAAGPNGIIHPAVAESVREPARSAA